MAEEDDENEAQGVFVSALAHLGVLYTERT